MSQCLASLEAGDGAPRRSHSSLTLTLTNNSTSSTPQPSRTPSTEIRREKSGMQTEDMAKTAKASQRYLFHELDPSFMTLVLVTCFFIAGLIDSVAYNSWNCFVNMQTGNTIFTALGISGQPQASHKQQYYKSLTSIGAFCFGSLFFSALHRYHTGLANPPSSLRRLNLIISFLIQACFIVIAASLVSTHKVSNQPFVPGSFSSGSATNPASKVNFLDLCTIALVSFQAAGQVTLSRLLGAVELPTIVASALYHDVCADLWNIRESWRKSWSIWEFVTVHQKRQEKRAACIVALFVGGVIGGEMYKSSAGMGGALWLAAGLKFAILVAWIFWRKEKDEGDLIETLPR